MARLTKAQQAEIAAANEQALTELVADPLEVIRPYLAQAGVEEAEVLFYLYRVVEDGKRVDAFLFKCKPEDYDPEQLGKQYGSGTYRMKVYVKDVDHPNGVVRAAPKFAVEMPPGYKPRAIEPDPTPAQPAQPQGVSAADIAGIVAQAVQQSMGAMMQALPKPLSFEEEMQRLKIMREVFAPATQAAPVAPADPLTEVTRTMGLIKMIKELNPEPLDTGDKATDLILEGVRTVSAAFANAKGAAPAMMGQPAIQANPAPLALQGALPAVPVAAPIAEPTPQPGDSEMGLMQKMMVGIAIGDAKKGADVSSDAAIFYEKADDDLLNIVIDGEDATGKNWFEVLCEINSDAKDYRPWFESFRAKVLEYDKANQAEHGEPDPAPASQTGLTTAP